ncbi:MAG TPA: class I tRNA ligase family protein, partial [Acidimicrobiales bacterium]|nr:class I tRNA ligase family protein [Acidimicrobiales bacterium]
MKGPGYRPRPEGEHARTRLLTAPLRVTGRLPASDLVALVTADALVGWARAAGSHADWTCPATAGDLAGQHAVDRELAREGRDRAIVARDEFIDRVRVAEASARDRAASLLGSLGADTDLAGLDASEPSLAARTAFVMLYEAGLLRFVDQVVDTCPRCLTAVDRADTEAADIVGEAVVLHLPTAGGRVVEVLTNAPELLLGVVAVAVPRGHPAAGDTVELGLAGRQVPVVVVDVDAPLLVVPAHDRRGLEIARRLRLAPVEVLDVNGVVRHDGPLDGLSRYAARAAATELLRADGLVAEQVGGTELTARCRRCRTVLVPRLGRHWVLPTAALEGAVADAVREGLVSFFPPAAREDFMAHAGRGGDWCVSYQVIAGQPVPASTCLDCGKVAVAVDAPESCPRCTGPLTPDLGVLDAGFVGAVWPLAANGWPGSVGADWPESTLVIGPDGL